VEFFYEVVEGKRPSDNVGDGGNAQRGSTLTGTSDVRYRADELATELGISVQVLRSYQSKGLIPPPRHEGRVAWYGAYHRDRLVRIRHLKDRGYSLRMIAETLTDEDGSANAPAEEHAVLRLADVAERSGVPVEVLRALTASRLLRPHHLSGSDLFSEADVRFVRQVLTLLGVGLSLDDLLRIARPLLEASDELGREVMGAWGDLVGSRLRRPDRADESQATRVAASVRSLAAIVGQLVAYQAERAVLDAARVEIDDHGSRAEREALSRALSADERT
jgi:DNA-binding transcriptional MerR regulator